MIKTTKMLQQELCGYGDRANKIARMVRDLELVPVVRGLYETDADALPWSLAGCIYGPSYISFESALSYYGLIPEAVRAVTSATFEKGKTKTHDTPFGLFLFRDVPSRAFPYGVEVRKEGDSPFRIAVPEKALCDRVYVASPVSNRKELEMLLYDDLRVDREDLINLDADGIAFLAGRYRSRNVERLSKYVKGGLRDG